MGAADWLSDILEVPLRAHDGYLDASEPTDDATERTFASFGFEWNKFENKPEDHEFWANYVRDLNLEALKDAVGLDAGCGNGRFTKFLAPHLRAMVALDGSSAVHAAIRNLADQENVAVVRADLRSEIFRPESFRFISSLGVLHHLPDPEGGFRHLVSLLEPGGVMLLYLYSRPETRLNVRAAGIFGAAALRAWTTKMPHDRLRRFSAPLATVLYATFVIPGAVGDSRGISALSRLPLATYRGRSLRSLWLDTFDRLSAPIEHRYVWSELAAWFQRAEMDVETARQEAGWFVVLRKPGGHQ